MTKSRHHPLIDKINRAFQPLAQVEAIGLAGSGTNNSFDQRSDFDLYIYTRAHIPSGTRKNIAEKLGAGKSDLNLKYWDCGDQWIDRESGIEIDLIYWDKTRITEQIINVLDQYQVRLGYTTCHVHTMKNTEILFEKDGFLTRLKTICARPYPPGLKKAIIEYNYPVLRDVIPSYYNQIKKALKRGDLISINHRLAAFLASYFDILFALNELMHPGEKKIMHFINEKCSKVPGGLSQHISDIFINAGNGNMELLNHISKMLNALDALLGQEGFPAG